MDQLGISDYISLWSLLFLVSMLYPVEASSFALVVQCVLSCIVQHAYE